PRATAATVLNSMSSVFATPARAVDRGWSRGVSGGRGSVEVMTPGYAAAHGASRRPGRVRCVVDRGVLDRGHGRVHEDPRALGVDHGARERRLGHVDGPGDLLGERAAPRVRVEQARLGAEEAQEVLVDAV